MQRLKSSRSSAQRNHAAGKRPMDLKSRLDATAPMTRREALGFSLKEILDPYWSWRFVRMSRM